MVRPTLTSVKALESSLAILDETGAVSTQALPPFRPTDMSVNSDKTKFYLTSKWTGFSQGIYEIDTSGDTATKLDVLPWARLLAFPFADDSFAYAVDYCGGLYFLNLASQSSTWFGKVDNATCEGDLVGVAGFEAVARRDGSHLLMILKGNRVTFMTVDPPQVPSGPPSFTPEGVVNAANFQPVPRLDGPLARGAIYSIFGENLAVMAGGAPSLPLPTNLGGTRVVATDNNGTQHECPLYYASPGQLNVLIPHEIPDGSGVILQVHVGDLAGNAIGFSVVDFAPALFRMPDQSPIVLHACSGEMVTTGHPLTVPAQEPCDDLFSLYGTGLGPTIPEVPSGEAAPENPLAWTVPETKVELSI